MIQLKQSTAVDLSFWMTDVVNPRLKKTGLSSLTIRMKKLGGSWATVTPTVTEEENGWYKMALTSAHTDTNGQLAFYITASGADDLPMQAQVVALLPGEDISAIKAKTDLIPNDVATVANQSQISLNIAGVLSELQALVGSPSVDISSDIAEVLSLVGAVKDSTDALPVIPASQADVTSVGDAVATVLGHVDTEVAAIKAKTDNLPAAPAAVSDVTTVGTAVAAVNTKLGTPAEATISADIALVLKTDEYVALENP